MPSPLSRRGQTAILFTLAAVPLFGIVGLAVDIGWAHFRQEAAQTAADSAAMGAALAAYSTSGGANMSCTSTRVACYATPYTCPTTFSSTPNNIEVGCMYAQANGFQTAGRQTVTFQSGVGSAPTAAGVTMSYWVIVRVSENIPQLFSAVLGYPTASVTARATTGAREASSGGCVITLNQIASGALNMTGNTNLQTGCGVMVNSNAADAVTTVGGGTINTTGNARTEIVGNWNGNGIIQVNGVAAQPLTGRPYSGDPFQDMAPPSVPTITRSVPVLGSQESAPILPGYYAGGINLSAHQSLTLAPGIYYVDGGISLGGQTSLSGSGVTIYVNSGSVSMAGGASVDLRAPSSGTWQGILFFQARGNTSEATLVGGTLQKMNGALYFPKAHLNYTGGSAMTTAATATTLVADTLTLVGGSNIATAASTLYTGNSGGVSLIE